MDGADLITPQLEARINEIACSFSLVDDGHREIGGFDFGRFDIRYESDEALQRGEGFKIVELNGTMSESTNLYDPRKNLWWAYGVLFNQWSRLYQLGGARRKTGVRPTSLADLLRAARDHYRGRPGSSISD